MLKLLATVALTIFYPGLSLTVTRLSSTTVQLQWSSQSATACYASWTAMKSVPTSGSATLPISSSTLYTLYCVGTQAMYQAAGSPTGGWPGNAISEPLSLYMPFDLPNAPTQLGAH